MWDAWRVCDSRVGNRRAEPLTVAKEVRNILFCRCYDNVLLLDAAVQKESDAVFNGQLQAVRRIRIRALRYGQELLAVGKIAEPCRATRSRNQPGDGVTILE